MLHRSIQLVFVVIILTVSAGASLAQQIQGEVRYAVTGRPVLGVLVHSSGTGGTYEQATDRNGKFYFRVSPGHYTITVRVPGYREETRSLDLMDKQQSEWLPFRLTEDGSGTTKPVGASGGVVNAAVPAKAREEFDKGAAAIAEAKNEKVQEGIAHLQRAINLYPQYLQAQLMLGTTYMDLQEWDKAEQALKKALVIDPNAANAMFALGEIYLRLKRDDDAEKILLQGLQVEDRSFQGHLTLGRVYWTKGSKLKDEAQWRPFLEKAYEQVNQALKMNPELAGAHLLKGNLLLRVGRDAGALHEFEEYLRLEPKGQFADPTRAMIEKIKKALAEQKPKP